MKLYVIRHGESESNLHGTYTGWADVPLTAKGVEDAKETGKILANIPFDIIFTSDLIRAKQTAQSAIPGCSYEETPLLREVNVGSISGSALSSISPEMRQEMDAHGFTQYGGESRQAFNDRILTFMRQMEELDCEFVAAFSHGGWLRGMLNQVVGCALPRKAVCCENCTVAIFEFEKEIWKLHSWINPL